STQGARIHARGHRSAYRAAGQTCETSRLVFHSTALSRRTQPASSITKNAADQAQGSLPRHRDSPDLGAAHRVFCANFYDLAVGDGIYILRSPGRFFRAFTRWSVRPEPYWETNCGGGHAHRLFASPSGYVAKHQRRTVRAGLYGRIAISDRTPLIPYCAASQLASCAENRPEILLGV